MVQYNRIHLKIGCKRTMDEKGEQNMKKSCVLFLALLMLFSVMTAVPVTTVAAVGSEVVLNETFETDATTWTTVNDVTVSRVSGGADGSGYALKTYMNKGFLSLAFKDKGAASFAFAPAEGKMYALSADVKLVTCSTTTPTTVSFVLKDSAGTETVIPATLDSTLSTSSWTHCSATYTATANIASIELRIGNGTITTLGSSSGSWLKSYTFEFWMDNLCAARDTLPLETTDVLAMDFNSGWFPSWEKISGDTTLTWTDTDTYGGSAGALKFTTTTDHAGQKFPLRYAAGNTYDVSVWVKPDETPAMQRATFIFYGKTADGVTAWNEVVATLDSNFEAGKWTLCTATMEATGKGITYIDGVRTDVDIQEVGTIEFRLGNGKPAEVMEGTISYTMDDFFVFPTVDNKLVPKELVTNGGLTTEAAFSESWKANSANTSTITWMEEGANGTAGSANVEVLKDWGTMCSKNTLEIEFGRNYELTFWAKATCEEAVGLQMYAYLMYNTHKQMEETPKWFVTYPTKEPFYLSTEWQKFSITFMPKSTTPEKIYPYLYFRAGTGCELITFAVDEISIVQCTDANFNVSASCMRALKSDDVFLQMNFTESSSNFFIYKVFHETENGEELLMVKKTKENLIHFAENDLPAEGNIRMEVLGVDVFDRCSQISSCKIEDAVKGDTISLNKDQFIWTDDVEALSGTIVYDNKTADRELRLIGAQYNAEGELLFADEIKKIVTVGEKQEWQVSIPVQETATKAKFFAWFADNIAPATPLAEIDKTTNGEFIYLDANSTANTEDGSFQTPYKTFESARAKLRDYVANSAEKDIYVIFKSGEYVSPNYSTIELTNAEYSADKNVIFTTLEGEKAAISGAKHISGDSFELYDGTNQIYRTSVDAGTQSRQLFVNGIKATRARSQEDVVPFTNLDYEEYQPHKDAGTTADYVFNNLGMTSTDTSFLTYKYPNELEIAFIENWRHQFIMADTITETTDEAGNALAHFGFIDGGNKSMWKQMLTLNTNAKIPVYVENALELLDEAGEWYLDTHENYLYYKPRDFETMDDATDFIIPVQSKLLTLKGTPDAHAKNVTFQNIDFTYTTWNYPTEARAFRNNQNAFFTNPEGGLLMPGAVEVYDASNITFDNCDFAKIGSMGLKMTGAIQHSNVIGNEFYEISGNALALGDVSHEDNAHKNQIINPTDSKFYITDNVIANNYIHKIATDYYSAAAVSVGFPINTTIRNNEITDCPYSGMHTGYGWGSYASTGTITKNFVIEKNYIHDILNWRMYDGGGIYTLGATGGTLDNMNVIRRNYFEDIKNGYGSIYPDEGSTYWDVTENVIDQRFYPTFYFKDNGTPYAAVWLHIHTGSIQHIHAKNNYSTTSTFKENGTFNQCEEPIVVSDANWTGEAKKIVEEAGIEKEYRNRFVFDIQSVRVPRRIQVNAGETAYYACEILSSKSKVTDIDNLEIEIKNTNPESVTATENTLTGLAEGNAWITMVLTRKENGVVTYYDEFSFYVVVE